MDLLCCQQWPGQSRKPPAFSPSAPYSTEPVVFPAEIQSQPHLEMVPCSSEDIQWLSLQSVVSSEMRLYAPGEQPLLHSGVRGPGGERDREKVGVTERRRGLTPHSRPRGAVLGGAVPVIQASEAPTSWGSAQLHVCACGHAWQISMSPQGTEQPEAGAPPLLAWSRARHLIHTGLGWVF